MQHVGRSAAVHLNSLRGRALQHSSLRLPQHHTPTAPAATWPLQVRGFDRDWFEFAGEPGGVYTLLTTGDGAQLDATFAAGGLRGQATFVRGLQFTQVRHSGLMPADGRAPAVQACHILCDGAAVGCGGNWLSSALPALTGLTPLPGCLQGTTDIKVLVAELPNGVWQMGGEPPGWRAGVARFQ